MLFIEVQQGTQEWLQARAGLITASEFSTALSMVGGLNDQQAKYVAFVLAGMDEKSAAAEACYKAVPKSEIIARALRGEQVQEFSDTAKRYAADTAIERISGMPYGEPPKTWILNRGHELEAAARMHYEARTGAFVTEAGICVEGPFAYSTDGLVDDDGLIEIKCPIDSTKILRILQTGDVTEYMHQMQGGMWITGRKYCDFIMYAPALESVGRDLYVKRILRDDEFIDDMVSKLVDFDALINSYVAQFNGSQSNEKSRAQAEVVAA